METWKKELRKEKKRKEKKTSSLAEVSQEVKLLFDVEFFFFFFLDSDHPISIEII